MRLRHKDTYTYATVSPHKKRLLVLFPSLSHPHDRAATVGAPYNRPSASPTHNPRVRTAWTIKATAGSADPPAHRLHEFPLA